MSDLAAASGRARVVVFAHAPVLAIGLSDLLSSDPGTEVVGATVDLTELVELLVDHDAQVVVAEVLNDSENPSRLFDVIHSTERRRSTPVSVVCVIPSPAAFAQDLQRRGATAVVTMTDDPSALQRAVTDATTVSTLDMSRLATAGRTPARPTLTARELDVLQGMVDGLSSRRIAETLGVSVNTVRTHVQRLLPKLGAHNRLRAAAIAIEHGLVTPTVGHPLPRVGD